MLALRERKKEGKRRAKGKDHHAGRGGELPKISKDETESMKLTGESMKEQAILYQQNLCKTKHC